MENSIVMAAEHVRQQRHGPALAHGMLHVTSGGVIVIVCFFAFSVESSNPGTVTHFQFSSSNETGHGYESCYNGWSMQNEMKLNEIL